MSRSTKLFVRQWRTVDTQLPATTFKEDEVLIVCLDDKTPVTVQQLESVSPVRSTIRDR